MKFYIHEKSWDTIKEELKTSKTVIVPLGALEAHGPQNPVGCCYLLAESASKSVGEKTGITVTPVIPFGVSTPYQNFPGTITVQSRVLQDYVLDVCRSLVRAGYKKIVFFSAHGGNNLPVLKEVALNLRESHGVLCAVVHLWGIVGQLAQASDWGEGVVMGHGGEPTTSTILHLYPELVDLNKTKVEPKKNPLESFTALSHENFLFDGVRFNIPLFAEEISDSSVLGDPTKASSEVGKQLYDRLITLLVAFVENFEKVNPSLELK